MSAAIAGIAARTVSATTEQIKRRMWPPFDDEQCGSRRPPQPLSPTDRGNGGIVLLPGRRDIGRHVVTRLFGRGTCGVELSDGMPAAGNEATQSNRSFFRRHLG